MFTTRKLLTVLLISLALCGIQVAQASPLHDHVGHISGCSLCHFDGAQAIRAPETGTPAVPAAAPVDLRDVVASCTNPVFPAYLTRAPPFLSC